MTTQIAQEKLSVVEKVGYSLGDLAANLIFQTLVAFLAFFYTDVYQIPAAQAATIIFIGGMVGAFFNPVMGIIADRTHTRYGKYRPWILWTSVPFGVVALLAFSTPDFSPDGKVYYALGTYILLVLVYSANNLPYASLSGVLTGSMAQRNSLSSYRFFAVMVAQFVIQVMLLPLVLMMGDGDKALGFKNTMMLFSVVGIVFFIITFLTTKERVIASSQSQSSVKQDLLDLVGNRPWWIILFVTILIFVSLSLKGGAFIYYFTYVLDKNALGGFLDSSGFNSTIASLNTSLNQSGLFEFKWPEDAATSAFSLFNAVGIVTSIIGIGFSKYLADRFGKRDVFGGALFIATVFIALFYLIPTDNIAGIFWLQVGHGFFYGITIPLLWAMIADVADFSEWKLQRRATGIVFSAMIFGLKAGLSIGGALVASLLAVYGYEAGAETQSSTALQGIKLSVSVFASLPFFTAVALLFIYEINKQTEHQIEQDLAQRRVQ